MKLYFVFHRSCNNWKEFAEAEKVTVETGLTYSEARAMCQEKNAELTEAEKERGKKYEFTEE